MLKPKKLANNNFLSSLDLSTDEIIHIQELAKNFKNQNDIFYIFVFTALCLAYGYSNAVYLGVRYQKNQD